MKKFKRILSSVLVVAMMLSFAACGKDSSEQDGDVTLTWYIPASQQPDEELVEAEVNKITKEKLGVLVDLKFIDTAAYGERMNMTMASGNDFDICFTGYVNPYIKSVDNGGYLEIDELLKKEAPKLYESFPEYAWEIAKVNGKIYGVPNLQGFAPPTSLWVSKERADKYGLDTSKVEKPEDLEPFFAAIKADDPSIIPFRPNYGTALWVDGIYEVITGNIGIRVDGSSKEVVYIPETPEYKKAIEVMNDWYKKGYIRNDVVSSTSDSSDYNAERYAVSAGGWLPGSDATQANRFGKEYIPMKICKAVMSKTKSLAALTAIGKNSKHPVEAIKLLELVNTDPELMSILALGIKDKNYTLDADGKYEKIKDSGWSASEWLFGTQFIGLIPKGSDDNIWEETDKMNREAIQSPLLGFTLNTDEIKTLVSQVDAAGGEYTATQAIVNGYSEIEKQTARKREAGLDKLIVEVQKQVDAYWAENFK